MWVASLNLENLHKVYLPSLKMEGSNLKGCSVTRAFTNGLTCESCREEREKLNVWVAWLNLENLHGSPPDEAVMKLFQRALPHTDAKKLYLALLTILERTSKVCLYMPFPP